MATVTQAMPEDSTPDLSAAEEQVIWVEITNALTRGSELHTQAFAKLKGTPEPFEAAIAVLAALPEGLWQRSQLILWTWATRESNDQKAEKEKKTQLETGRQEKKVEREHELARLRASSQDRAPSTKRASSSNDHNDSDQDDEIDVDTGTRPGSGSSKKQGQAKVHSEQQQQDDLNDDDDDDSVTHTPLSKRRNVDFGNHKQQDSNVAHPVPSGSRVRSDKDQLKIGQRSRRSRIPPAVDSSIGVSSDASFVRRSTRSPGGVYQLSESVVKSSQKKKGRVSSSALGKRVVAQDGDGSSSSGGDETGFVRRSTRSPGGVSQHSQPQTSSGESVKEKPSRVSVKSGKRRALSNAATSSGFNPQTAGLKRGTQRSGRKTDKGKSKRTTKGRPGPIPTVGCVGECTHADGCNRSAAGNVKPFCSRHGGKKQCTHESGCPLAVKFNALCTLHGGGARCTFVDGCTNQIQSMGLCKLHGGGRKCTHKSGCQKPGRDGGVCSAHGGVKRCTISGCEHGEVRKGLCTTHGGGRQCEHNGCTKNANIKGLCCAHGGVLKCGVDGCSKIIQSKGVCIAHGGGKKCKHTSGCSRNGERFGMCAAHGGGRICRYEGGCLKVVQKKGFCVGHFREVNGLVLVDGRTKKEKKKKEKEEEEEEAFQWV